mmetsp:Transcript_156823/g.289102  ORF Transcript_156823/g.289102 Transcript_156823/m.289102 type:complete len:202 (+) Transcript_156823:471-1076(+)
MLCFALPTRKGSCRRPPSGKSSGSSPGSSASELRTSWPAKARFSRDAARALNRFSRTRDCERVRLLLWADDGRSKSLSSNSCTACQSTCHSSCRNSDLNIISRCSSRNCILRFSTFHSSSFLKSASRRCSSLSCAWCSSSARRSFSLRLSRCWISASWSCKRAARSCRLCASCSSFMSLRVNSSCFILSKSSVRARSVSLS